MRTGCYRFIKFATVIIAAFAIVCMMTPAVFAEVQSSADRETPYFNVSIRVNENNSYDYTETIGTIFNKEGHGIYRYIPTEFDGISETVDSGWCSTDPIETEYEDNCYILKIGSGDRTISGRHEFEFGYRYTFRDDRDTTQDLMYIDVLPTDWQTPIGSSEITIKMPKEVSADSIQVFAGKYGNAKSADSIWTLSQNRQVIKIKTGYLEQGVGITVMAKLPEGYWVGQEDSREARGAAAGSSAAAVLLLAGMWFGFGRKQKVVETVEFYPPEGVTPAEIGLMIDGTLDKKDMVSMFMYFAHKGYLTIKEEGRKFRFDKVKDMGDGEKRFAKTLFDGIFDKGRTSVRSSEFDEDFGYSYMAACDVLKDDFGDVMPASSRLAQRLGGILIYAAAFAVPIFAISYMVRDDLYIYGALLCSVAAAFMTGRMRNSYRNRLSGKKSGSRAVRMIYWIIDAVLIIIAGVGIGTACESTAIGALYIAAFAACQIFNVYFDRMSDKAYKNMGQILGLRNFIKTAEVDRINELVEQDPQYFFNILPYAYVLGLTDKWAKKFESIRTEYPAWYSSDSGETVFPAVYIGHSMNNMANNVASSVRASLPEGSLGGSDSGGGFSGGGGGFSGGGGGGGGGGFW